MLESSATVDTNKSLDCTYDSIISCCLSKENQIRLDNTSPSKRQQQHEKSSTTTSYEIQKRPTMRRRSTFHRKSANVNTNTKVTFSVQT